MASAAEKEKQRLNRMVAGMEKELQKSFLLFIEAVTSPGALKQVSEFLDKGDINGALNFVNKFIADIGGTLHRIMTEAGVDEAKNLSAQLGPALAGSFDPGNPDASRRMRENQLRFVAELQESQKNAIRQALTEALDTGQSGRQAAIAFRDAIGLTARQEAAVRNYRRLLETGSSEALDRDLRDRRFDRSTEGNVLRYDPREKTYVRTEEPLKASQIDKMVERYRERSRQARAETIGRTETTNAFSLGREEALRQVQEKAGIPADRVERTWNATSGARTRDTHARMNGQKRSMTEKFTSPSGARLQYPGDRSAPAGETIHCRCVVTNRIKAPA